MNNLDSHTDAVYTELKKARDLARAEASDKLDNSLRDYALGIDYAMETLLKARALDDALNQ